MRFRAVIIEGMSEREAARQFGPARETVRKMVRYAVLPGYQRQKPVRRPKLDAWIGIIDQIMEQDKRQPRKQRHTVKRIHDRLKAEHGYTGGYTIVKDYVRLRKLRQREMFVPLEHPPGDAQADFGEAQVVIAGLERKAHYLVMDLPQSDDCFVIAFPAEATEAFLEGHTGVRVFRRSATDDPLRQHQAGGGADFGRWNATEDAAFSEFQSHCLFQEKFGRPGKSNDKGKVEGLVGYARRNSLCRSRAWRVGTS